MTEVNSTASSRLSVSDDSSICFTLKNLGQRTAALDAYQLAMTADTGASEEIAREAALNILRIHHSDPEVQTARAEAAAVATLFEAMLGAGTALPQEFRCFLNTHPGESSVGEKRIPF